MPDKRTVCSMADSIVFDYIPKKIGDVIDKNITITEDIRAAVRGMKDETLVVTDKGVYIIKKGACNFFPYDQIMQEKSVSRVYRRGRFEVPLEGKGETRLPDERKEPDFGPDPAPNVVNFPWSKAELFQKAEQIISINKELHDAKTGIQATTEINVDDKYFIGELLNEIRKLNDQLTREKEKNREREKGEE